MKFDDGFYNGKAVLVTGGLGFIGSNLAIRLAGLGARVTVVDSSVEGCGANPHNLAPVSDQVDLIPLAICEAEVFTDKIAHAEVIFNLAGDMSHIHSMEHPERDLQINTVAQLQFLQVCARVAPGIRVVYAGTRQVYGKPKYIPVDEEHPVQPIDYNGIHKYAATMYHMLMSRSGKLDAVALRLTNVYGPRMALNIPCQGFLSTFLRNVILGDPLEILGDGNQLRDPVYIDEAVDAFLLAGSIPHCPSRIYNVGGPEALRIADIAAIASRAAGRNAIRYRPFPELKKEIEIGSYCTDKKRTERDLGWKAVIQFDAGMRMTLDYYREHLSHYLDPVDPRPVCLMPEHNGVERKLSFTAVSR